MSTIHKLVREHLTAFLVGLALTAMTTIALGGYGAAAFVDSLATKSELTVLAYKADYVLDRQIESLVGQISYLERKGNLTPSERQQLNYLREQLKQLRRVRDGK